MAHWITKSWIEQALNCENVNKLPKVAKAQILKFQEPSDNNSSDGEVTGIISDKNLFVKAVFSKTAVEQFKRDNPSLDILDIRGGLIFIKKYSVDARLLSDLASAEFVINVKEFKFAGGEGNTQFGSDVTDSCTYPPLQPRLMKLSWLRRSQIKTLLQEATCHETACHENACHATACHATACHGSESLGDCMADIRASLLKTHEHVFIPKDTEEKLADIPEWKASYCPPLTCNTDSSDIASFESETSQHRPQPAPSNNAKKRSPGKTASLLQRNKSNNHERSCVNVEGVLHELESFSRTGRRIEDTGISKRCEAPSTCTNEGPKTMEKLLPVDDHEAMSVDNPVICNSQASVVIEQPLKGLATEMCSSFSESPRQKESSEESYSLLQGRSSACVKVSCTDMLPSSELSEEANFTLAGIDKSYNCSLTDSQFEKILEQEDSGTVDNAHSPPTSKSVGASIKGGFAQFAHSPPESKNVGASIHGGFTQAAHSPPGSKNVRASSKGGLAQAKARTIQPTTPSCASDVRITQGGSINHLSKWWINASNEIRLGANDSLRTTTITATKTTTARTCTSLTRNVGNDKQQYSRNQRSCSNHRVENDVAGTARREELVRTAKDKTEISQSCGFDELFSQNTWSASQEPAKQSARVDFREQSLPVKRKRPHEDAGVETRSVNRAVKQAKNESVMSSRRASADSTSGSFKSSGRSSHSQPSDISQSSVYLTQPVELFSQHDPLFLNNSDSAESTAGAIDSESGLLISEPVRRDSRDKVPVERDSSSSPSLLDRSTNEPYTLETPQFNSLPSYQVPAQEEENPSNAVVLTSCDLEREPLSSTPQDHEIEASWQPGSLWNFADLYWRAKRQRTRRKRFHWCSENGEY